MNTSKFGKMSLIGLSLLTAGLCAGCGAQTKEDNRAKPGDTPYSVMYYHDDFHRVSCWVTSFAMHCLPDGSVANGGA